VTWVRLAGNIYTPHNFSHFAIYQPKLIKVSRNSMKFHGAIQILLLLLLPLSLLLFWQKQKCTVFWDMVYI